MKRAISKIKLFNNLTKEMKEEISKLSTIKKYKKGTLLYSDKETINTVYFMVNGVASLYKPDTQNGRKIVFVFGAGDVLNEVIVYENTTTLSCELLANSEILEIDREDFLILLEKDYPLCKGVIDSLVQKNRKMSHQIKNTSNSITVDRQIAFKLWKLARDFGIKTEKGIEIDFDLSITYLADMLGAKRETVSRQLKLLTEKDLVNVVRKRFTIKDSEKLLKYFRAEKE